MSDVRYVKFRVVDDGQRTLGTFPNIVFAQLFLRGLLDHGFKDVSIRSCSSDVSPFDKLARYFGLDSVQGDLFDE